jgi:Shedu protein SduA, N-terminal
MDRKVIVSTSSSSADCTDILLREKATARLVFRPELVDNPHEHAAAVRGTFIYQRKSPKGTWQSTDTISLSTLKKDEGYKLELASGELLALVRELVPLYKLHAKHGIPFSLTELVPVDSAVANLAALPADQVRTYLSANEAVGEQLLSTLLDWVAGLPEPSSLVPRLLSLGPAALRNLNVAVGLGRLKHA